MSKATGKAKAPMNPEKRVRDAVLAAADKYYATGESDALFNALNPRQRLFAEEYCVDFNGTAAAVRAGYSPNWADRAAHQLIRNPGVAAYIAFCMKQKAGSITVVDNDYIIQGIVAIANKQGARDSDKLRALELLAKHLGMFSEKIELTGKDGNAIEIEQRTKEANNEFIAAINRMAERRDNKIDVEIV